MRSRSEGVVSLELDHGPYDDPHGCQPHFEPLELREQGCIDAVPSLVSTPQVVAEGFDDMIGGDAQVSGAALDHLQDGMQHPGYGAVRLVAALVETAQAVEVPEELIGAVDEVNDHSRPSVHRFGEWVQAVVSEPANDANFEA